MDPCISVSEHFFLCLCKVAQLVKKVPFLYDPQSTLQIFHSLILQWLLCAAACLGEAWIPLWVPCSGPAFLKVTGSKRVLGDGAGACQTLPAYKEAGLGSTTAPWLSRAMSPVNGDSTRSRARVFQCSRLGHCFHAPQLSSPLLCHRSQFFVPHLASRV